MLNMRKVCSTVMGRYAEVGALYWPKTVLARPAWGQQWWARPGEWLALRSAFTAPAKPAGCTIAARTHTFLKKSECHSSTLPPSMSKPIPKGTVVTVVGDVDAVYALVKDAR